jgi:hypothetical protein
MNNNCLIPDFSKISINFLYIPNRVNDSAWKKADEDGVVFKTYNYYSLLIISSLLKPSKKNPIMFYYLNDQFKPLSNHYNRWLNDTFWREKIPIESVKFINLNYQWNITTKTNKFNFDMYDIFENVLYPNSLKNIPNLDKKEYLLFLTSDVIIGPKLLTCFSRDFSDHTVMNENDESSKIFNLNIQSLRENISKDCFLKLNNNYQDLSVYSFLYKMDTIHNPKDFSGILVVKLNNSTKFNNKRFINNSNTFSLHNLVTKDNIYKCTYKTELLKVNLTEFITTYENSFCIFGYELNTYEPPNIQSIFFDNANRPNYMEKLLRNKIFGFSEQIEYKMQNDELDNIFKIPNIVHMIWFGEEFRKMKYIEYLSLKSILTVLKPDKVKIHGDNQPVCDLWKELIKHPKVEWINMKRPIKKYNQDFSNSPIQHLADVARLEVIYNEGGIYSDFDILWVKPIDKFRFIDVELVASNDLTSYCNEFPFNIQIGAFLAPPHSSFVSKWLKSYQEKYHLHPGDYAAVSMCEPYKLYEKQPQKVYIDNKLQMIYFNGWSSFIPRYCF